MRCFFCNELSTSVKCNIFWLFEFFDLLTDFLWWENCAKLVWMIYRGVMGWNLMHCFVFDAVWKFSRLWKSIFQEGTRKKWFFKAYFDYLNFSIETFRAIKSFSPNYEQFLMKLKFLLIIQRFLTCQAPFCLKSFLENFHHMAARAINQTPHDFWQNIEETPLDFWQIVEQGEFHLKKVQI